MNMHAQAEKFGARFSYSEVTDFEGLADHVRIKADDDWLETRALIIASGASGAMARPGERRKSWSATDLHPALRATARSTAMSRFA